jgi:hypothetical protein
VICARGVPITTSLLDPAGVVVEAYAGMLQIDDQDTYGPVDWSQVPNALRLRDGVVPPESFFTHGAPGRAGACRGVQSVRNQLGRHRFRMARTISVDFVRTRRGVQRFRTKRTLFGRRRPGLA